MSLHCRRRLAADRALGLSTTGVLPSLPAIPVAQGFPIGGCLPAHDHQPKGGGLFKFYCLRQVHLAENLPQATHTQDRVKTT